MVRKGCVHSSVKSFPTTAIAAGCWNALINSIATDKSFVNIARKTYSVVVEKLMMLQQGMEISARASMPLLDLSVARSDWLPGFSVAQSRECQILVWHTLSDS